jgi:hypothetical protein
MANSRDGQAKSVDMTSVSGPNDNTTTTLSGRTFSAFSLQNKISCVPVDDVSKYSNVTAYLANHSRLKIICSMASSKDCVSITVCRQCLQNPQSTNLSRRMCSIAAMVLDILDIDDNDGVSELESIPRCLDLDRRV